MKKTEQSKREAQSENEGILPEKFEGGRFFFWISINMETLYDDTDDERQEKRGTAYSSFIIGKVNTALVFHCIT